MKGDYIFMLASWFPNQAEPTSGNFVESHVESIGINNKVIVLYIKYIDRKRYYKDTEEQKGNILYITKYVVKPNSDITKIFIYYNYCLKIFKQYGKPKFTQVHVAWPVGVVAWLLKKLKGISYIITEHSSRYLAMNVPRLRFLEKKVFANAAAVTAVSTHLASDMKALFALKNEPVIIPNIIDEVIYNTSKHAEKEKYFLHISNFAPVKQSTKIIQAFIKALPHIPNYQLYMYGEDGDEKDDCIKLALNAGVLNRSVFIGGIISKKEVAEKMSKATALISYSIYETQGITVFEALACNCPVICNNIVSFVQLVKPELGILVNNDQELGDAIIKMAEGKHPINFETYTAKYHSHTINSMFNNLYKDLNLV